MKVLSQANCLFRKPVSGNCLLPSVFPLRFSWSKKALCHNPEEESICFWTSRKLNFELTFTKDLFSELNCKGSAESCASLNQEFQ